MVPIMLVWRVSIGISKDVLGNDCAAKCEIYFGLCVSIESYIDV